VPGCSCRYGFQQRPACINSCIDLRPVYSGGGLFEANFRFRCYRTPNISSGAATSALEGWSHYCSTKAAVLSLTRCADKEYRDAGVRVVGLSPGTVATEMQVAIKASGLNPVSQLDPSAHIPPEWAARAVVWLCTDTANDLAGVDFSLKDAAGRARVGLPS